LKSFWGWRDSEKVVKILFEEMMLGLGIEQMARILEELSLGELEIFEFPFFNSPASGRGSERSWQRGVVFLFNSSCF